VDKHALCAWHRSGAARDIRKLTAVSFDGNAPRRELLTGNARAEVSELALVETICDELRASLTPCRFTAMAARVCLSANRIISFSQAILPDGPIQPERRPRHLSTWIWHSWAGVE